jgi:hypothetical protein
VAFEYRVSYGELRASVGHARPCFQPAGRHGHIVARRREASDFLEIPYSFLHSGPSLILSDIRSRDECIAAGPTARDGNCQDACQGASEVR